MNWLLLTACHALGPWGQGTATDSGTSDARVSVSPGLLDFGSVSVNMVGERSLSFTIYNLSSDPVTITGHDEQIGDRVFTVDAEPLLEIAAHSEQDVPVLFQPGLNDAFEADILVRPAEEVLHLQGTGAAPVLRFGEETVPATVVGCSGAATIPIWNDGVENLTLQSASSSSEEFEVAGFPSDIRPGESGLLELSFSPHGTGLRGTAVQVASSDPSAALQSINLEGLGYEGGKVTETFLYHPTNPTDILMVAEGSGSDGRGSASSSYISTLRSFNVDYQISALAGTSPCPTGAPAYSDRSDTALQGSAVMERAFRAGEGAWDQNLLGLAVEALTQVSPCLQGFRRYGADLEILVVSDGPSLRVEESDLNRLFEIAKPGNLRISALIPDACGNAEAYAPAIEATGGRRQDWCASDWAPAMEALAALPTGLLPVHFPLTQIPVASTIQVEVEGQTYNSWSWDPTGNEILFSGSPTLGATITIRYVAAVSCEP